MNLIKTNKHKFIAFVLIWALFPAYLFADEQWSVRPFTQTLGGGPATGPVEQAGSSADSICGDKNGNLYIAENQMIDIVTPDGLRMHLAGTGVPGFRDGDAETAQFRMGYNAYYHAYNIACTADGEIYIADGGNRKIRKLFRTDGKWIVVSWAGGGNKTGTVSRIAHPSEIKFRGTISVAINTNGTVHASDNHGYFRIPSDGKSITYTKWPESVSAKKNQAPQLNIMAGDNDRNGNVFFVSRTPDVIIKINKDGQVQHFAGIVVRGKKPHHIGDTLPLNAYFDTPTSLVASPDNTAIYTSGGDEYDIRRIPENTNETTSTLMINGRWGIAKKHPNNYRGPAIVSPDKRGNLRPDGNLTVMMVSSLIGRDYAGRIYGSMYSWTGMTQYIENKGLLGTRIFRLERMQDE